MIKVLVVDDSTVLRELITHILHADGGIQVVGTAKNGKEAIESLKSLKPDVITMDINMPTMGGFEATQKIMESHPVPILIVSASWNPQDVEFTFRSMEAGAVACIEKPLGFAHPEYQQQARALTSMVKLMSEVKVVRRWPQARITKEKVTAPIGPSKLRLDQITQDVRLVCIGASTGGPPVLQEILKKISRDLSIPILIVQHIATGFLEGMAVWLEGSTGFPCHVAKQSEPILPGHIYFAPDDYHMGITRSCRIELNNRDPKDHGGLRPSVSYLFRSVARALGQNAIAVLLSGMGKDGSEELRLIKEKGGITLVQDRESSIVHGMPGEAIKLGGATFILPPSEIAQAINSIVAKKRTS